MKMNNDSPLCMRCNKKIETWSLSNDMLMDYLGDNLIEIYSRVLVENTKYTIKELEKMSIEELHQLLCKNCSWELMNEKMNQNRINYKENAKNRENDINNSQNKYANWGMGLGIASIFFASIGVVPILAMVISGIAITKKDLLTKKYQDRAVIGMILGIVFFVVNLFQYGHI